MFGMCTSIDWGCYGNVCNASLNHATLELIRTSREKAINLFSKPALTIRVGDIFPNLTALTGLSLMLMLHPLLAKVSRQHGKALMPKVVVT
jgi:hypothetical protein